MSRSQVVAEHLPLLRRYARALTGSQSSGDAYVAAMLEALLQDTSLLDERHGPRAGLFRLFTQIWNSVSVNEKSDVTPLPLPSERRLSNITPLPRQAFLLLSLEGFSEEEVAFILGTDIAETRRLADAAGREMAAEIATDVLIIEDETFIAMDLESLVKNLGHNVIGVARTHTDAVALAKNRKPGLILADIQLADGSSGLEAVNELLRTFEVPVVFITAYPERFLTGERPEPAFLISKPFQPAMVSAVASQALFFQRNSRNRAPRGVGLEVYGWVKLAIRRALPWRAGFFVARRRRGASAVRKHFAQHRAGFPGRQAHDLAVDRDCCRAVARIGRWRDRSCLPNNLQVGGRVAGLGQIDLDPVPNHLRAALRVALLRRTVRSAPAGPASRLRVQAAAA